MASYYDLKIRSLPPEFRKFLRSIARDRKTCGNAIIEFAVFTYAAKMKLKPAARREFEHYTRIRPELSLGTNPVKISLTNSQE